MRRRDLCRCTLRCVPHCVPLLDGFFRHGRCHRGFVVVSHPRRLSTRSSPGLGDCNLLPSSSSLVGPTAQCVLDPESVSAPRRHPLESLPRDVLLRRLQATATCAPPLVSLHHPRSVVALFGADHDESGQTTRSHCSAWQETVEALNTRLRSELRLLVEGSTTTDASSSASDIALPLTARVQALSVILGNAARLRLWFGSEQQHQSGDGRAKAAADAAAVVAAVVVSDHAPLAEVALMAFLSTISEVWGGSLSSLSSSSEVLPKKRKRAGGGLRTVLSTTSSLWFGPLLSSSGGAAATKTSRHYAVDDDVTTLTSAVTEAWCRVLEQLNVDDVLLSLSIESFASLVAVLTESVRWYDRRQSAAAAAAVPPHDGFGSAVGLCCLRMRTVLSRRSWPSAGVLDPDAVASQLDRLVSWGMANNAITNPSALTSAAATAQVDEDDDDGIDSHRWWATPGGHGNKADFCSWVAGLCDAIQFFSRKDVLVGPAGAERDDTGGVSHGPSTAIERRLTAVPSAEVVRRYLAALSEALGEDRLLPDPQRSDCSAVASGLPTTAPPRCSSLRWSPLLRCVSPGELAALFDCLAQVSVAVDARSLDQHVPQLAQLLPWMASELEAHVVSTPRAGAWHGRMGRSADGGGRGDRGSARLTFLRNALEGACASALTTGSASVLLDLTLRAVQREALMFVQAEADSLSEVSFSPSGGGTSTWCVPRRDTPMRDRHLGCVVRLASQSLPESKRRDAEEFMFAVLEAVRIVAQESDVKSSGDREGAVDSSLRSAVAGDLDVAATASTDLRNAVAGSTSTAHLTPLSLSLSLIVLSSWSGTYMPASQALVQQIFAALLSRGTAESHPLLPGMSSVAAWCLMIRALSVALHRGDANTPSPPQQPKLLALAVVQLHAAWRACPPERPSLAMDWARCGDAEAVRCAHPSVSSLWRKQAGKQATPNISRGASSSYHCALEELMDWMRHYVAGLPP